jgi:hypothetical protein
MLKNVLTFMFHTIKVQILSQLDKNPVSQTIKTKFPCQNIRLHIIKSNVCILICTHNFSLDCKYTGVRDFKLKTYRTGMDQKQINGFMIIV